MDLWGGGGGGVTSELGNLPSHKHFLSLEKGKSVPAAAESTETYNLLRNSTINTGLQFPRKGQLPVRSEGHRGGWAGPRRAPSQQEAAPGDPLALSACLPSASISSGPTSPEARGWVSSLSVWLQHGKTVWSWFWKDSGAGGSPARLPQGLAPLPAVPFLP